MQKILRLKSFWLVFLLSSGVIFIALLNFNRVYKSETRILIIPKGEVAQNSRQIVENFREISYSLPFLNRMAEENPDVIDESVAEMTPPKKRAYWRTHLSVERIGESGILSIAGIDESRFRAEAVSGQVAKNIIRSAGVFYNIQTEVDIRVVDGPITEEALAWPVAVLVFESMIIGFLAAIFSFSVSFLIFDEKKPAAFDKPEAWPWYRVQKDKREVIWQDKPVSRPFPKYPENSWKPESENQPAKKTPEKKQAPVFRKRAAAPDNLPVAPETLGAEIFKEPSQQKKEPAREEKKEKTDGPIIREATPEEVKERLNKLLSGKF